MSSSVTNDNSDHDLNVVSAEDLLATIGESVGLSTGAPSHSLENNLSSSNYDQAKYTSLAEDLLAANWGNFPTEGLLSPLKRPDPNQMPPDVLALLLKSNRCGEMLNGSSASSYQDILANDARFYSPSSVVESSPNLESHLHHLTISGQNKVADSPSNLKTAPVSKFNFSPAAPEFVPRQQFEYLQPREEESFFEAGDDDQILSCVTETITQLTRDPRNFDYYAKKIVKVINDYHCDAETLIIVINLIIEQSISVKDFALTGARLCEEINKKSLEKGDLSVKINVIARVQEHFYAIIESINQVYSSPETIERSYGLLYFLAEIFKCFKIESGVTFFGFGVAAVELMHKYLKSDAKSYNHVKHTVNVLKLAGYYMDKHQNPKLRQDFEKLMIDLASIATLPSVSKDAKQLINKVLELRKINWGIEEEVESSAQSSKKYEEPAETVTYGGKTHNIIYEPPPESDEETFIDDESEEVSKFYDEFIRDLNEKKK